MSRTNLLAPCLLALITLAADTLPAPAGPLAPAAGPVASTMKTLAEVEPRTAINLANTPGDADSVFKIVQPGSYYLTGNVQGAAAKHGIEIVASGVTIDLNGFDVSGVVGSRDGIRANVTGLTSITVVNGSVRNCGEVGVNLGGLGASGSRIEAVVCASNVGDGISIGAGGVISRCASFLNGGRGVLTGIGAAVTNSSAVSNAGDGISAGSYSTVSQCTSSSNGASGINVGNGSSVIDCTAGDNDRDGIVCAAGCLIRGNTCRQNGSSGDGAGIHATLVDNRIEDNNCTGADRGIDVDSIGNIIIKNTCSGNTINWSIAANNICGPIIDRSVPASAAISGNSAPSSLGTTDPNANFSF